ncbi:hypothetical protein T439DRAFT_377976 [Meredithblackwellia eburnea MCA 4105]
MVGPLPAHETKELKLVHYKLPSGSLAVLHQDNSQHSSDNASTGRTIWLGAQILSEYLHGLLHKSDRFTTVDGLKRRKRCIELGAGTGLLSISLHHAGFDCIATDVPFLADTLLSKNLDENRSLAVDAPKLEARALDWFEDPETWTWSSNSDGGAITLASAEAVSSQADSDNINPLLAPPFDFIVTSDSVYDPTLTPPLLKVLHALSTPPNVTSASKPPPPIFLALEARDPLLIAGFLESARTDFNFKCTQVNEGKIEKIATGWGWSKSDWEGVQVWKLVLDHRKSVPT